MSDILRQIIATNRAGQAIAVPSVCSAHPAVLTASLMLARDLDAALVIEATSNQVNQDGGYTGMTPAGFISFVKQLSRDGDTGSVPIVFGGDHLGSQAWKHLPVDQAMDKARRLVADYAATGFTKIHLDCSEGCVGEPAQLPDKVTAERAAELARVALAAAPAPGTLLFVIGTEVPPPGGARAEESGEITPTTAAAAKATLDAHAAAFTKVGIADALPQIGGLVVQPGVEFSPMHVHHLPLARDPGFIKQLSDWPDICLEAHSTDYQHPEALARLAELGFAFQKVGPGLTFAWREAVYALDALARMAGWSGTALPDVMEGLMTRDPRHWQDHYRGDTGDTRVERHFGLADRVRYYWPLPEARAALQTLFAVLEDRALPEPLLHQFFPVAVIERATKMHVALSRALPLAAVQEALRPYFLRTAP